MAHAQRKTLSEPLKSAYAASEHVPKLVPVEKRTVAQARPQRQLGKLAPSISAIFFSVLTVAAIIGKISIWFVIPGILGLAVTGVLYLVAWSVDNVPEFH